MLLDLKYALSQLQRNIGITCAIVLTIAIGMAVTTGIYAIVNGVLIRPLPYRDQERLVVLWESTKDTPRFVVAPANFLDWKRQSATFSDMTAIQQFKEPSFAMTGAGDPEEFDGVRVTWNVFDVLGVGSIQGRLFRPEDGQVGRNGVALLSYGLWIRKFGGAASAVGRHVVLNGKPTEIVGVLPEGFQLPLVKADIFAPIAWDANEESERSVSNYLVIGRMKEGISIGQARTELSVIAKRIERTYPETNIGETVVIDPLYETIVGDIRSTLLTLFVAACLLLLLGSASVSNLLLARLSQRRTEIAIRVSVGASAVRIARQFLTETLVLSSIAGLVGLVLARYAVSAVLALSPDSVYFTIPRRADIGIDLSTFQFALAMMVTSGLLVGLGPACVASSADLNSLLKEGGRGSSAGRLHASVRRVLMGGQIALAFLLVTGTALTVKSFLNLRSVNPGFNADRILAAQVSLPASKYANDVQLRDFYRHLTDGVSSLPGVEAVSQVNFAPLVGVASMWSFHAVHSLAIAVSVSSWSGLSPTVSTSF